MLLLTGGLVDTRCGGDRLEFSVLARADLSHRAVPPAEALNGLARTGGLCFARFRDGSLCVHARPSARLQRRAG